MCLSASNWSTMVGKRTSSSPTTVVAVVVAVDVSVVVAVEVTDVVPVEVTDVVVVGVVVGVDVPVVVGEVTWHSNRLPPSCAAKAALNRIRSAGQVVTSASADAVRRSRGSQGAAPAPYILVQWSQLNMNSPSFATPVSLSTVLPRSNTVSSAGNWLNSYMISMVRFATISHSASELPNVRMLPSLKVVASSLSWRQSAHPIVMPTFLFSILCILDIQKRHNKKCTP